MHMYKVYYDAPKAPYLQFSLSFCDFVTSIYHTWVEFLFMDFLKKTKMFIYKWLPYLPVSGY